MYSIWYLNNDGEQFEVVASTVIEAYEQAALISRDYGEADIEDSNGNPVAHYEYGKFVR